MKTVEEIKAEITRFEIIQESLSLDLYWDLWKEMKGSIQALRWVLEKGKDEPEA